MTEQRPESSSTGMGPIEGESDIPWKPPVIAAILGALVVGIYVIYAIVAGPSIDDDGVPDSSSGYMPVTEMVGVRVEQVTSTPTLTHVAVSTKVNASIDPADVSPLDIAYWELRTPSGSVVMQDQYRWSTLVGAGAELLSVTFPAETPTVDGDLVAYVARTVVDTVTEFELPSDLPQTMSDVRIDLGEGVIVVIESVTIDEDGGYVEWTVEEGTVARVDVIVHFVGTGGSGAGDTLLVPAHVGPSLLDPELPEMPSVPYRFGSQYSLVRSGVPLDAADSPSAIVVEISVEAVTAVANPVALPLDR